jgi:hypothetical protein
MRMASRLGGRPEELASAIAARLAAEATSPGRRHDRGTSFEVVPPGFINVRLSPASTGKLARIVVLQGREYGSCDRLAGQRIDLMGECGVESDCPGELAEAGGPREACDPGVERMCDWSLTQARACLVRQALARILTAAGATITACWHDRAEEPAGISQSDVIREGDPANGFTKGGAFTDAGRVSFGQLVAVAGLEAARYHLIRFPSGFANRAAKVTPAGVAQGGGSIRTVGVVPVDLDRVARHVPENPAYYVRYVAAMAATTARNAQAAGVTFGAGYQPDLLVHDRELALLTALRDYPWVVDTSAELRLPHRVARYLEDLAAIYHDFSDCCRLRPDGDEMVSSRMRARLWLHEATRVVFANGLALLGVSAPDRM